MKLPNIVDDLLLIINHAKIPQAHKIRKEQIIQWVNNQRALWLANEYNKGRGIKNNEIQILENILMEVVDSEKLSTDLHFGNALIKSTKIIPRSIQAMVVNTMVSVRPRIELGERINLVSREQAIYAGNGILNGKFLFAYVNNDYLYVKYGNQADKSKVITNLRIEGVFEDPIAVDEFNGTPDNILLGTDEYPISMQFVEYIKGQLMQANVMALLNIPKDISSNDNAEN